MGEEEMGEQKRWSKKEKKRAKKKKERKGKREKNEKRRKADMDDIDKDTFGFYSPAFLTHFVPILPHSL